MESNGKEGNVVISERTKDLIESAFPEDYLFEEHNLVKIDALETEINTWLVYQNQSFT